MADYAVLQLWAPASCHQLLLLSLQCLYGVIERSDMPGFPVQMHLYLFPFLFFRSTDLLKPLETFLQLTYFRLELFQLTHRFCLPMHNPSHQCLEEWTDTQTHCNHFAMANKDCMNHGRQVQSRSAGQKQAGTLKRSPRRP